MKDRLSVIILLDNIDILIDGKYVKEERIYIDDFEDGLYNAVGSGNQVIWDLKNKQFCIEGVAAKDLAGIYVKPDNSLVFITKINTNPYVVVNRPTLRAA